jgi:uncharacterized SAM-binding protein YcdF (DUF218 family)
MGGVILKYAIKGIGIILIVFCISLILVIAGILQGWYTFKPAKSDCIIILGCKVDGVVSSPFLVSRIEEGYRLYNEKQARYIIASGGQGVNENISEAEAIKRYLVGKGVNEDNIILEDQSTSTWANLLNSKEIMKQRQFNNAIIVSNKFHLKRASMIANKIGIAASFSGVYNTKHKFDEFGSFLREILATYKFYVTNL